MTDTVTQPEVDEEAQAIQEALAGYEGKARAQAPAEPEEKSVEAAPLPDSATEESASDTDPEPEEANPPAEPAAPDTSALAHQLEDLKAQVKALAERNADAETVRKMHGEIGNINRTLKQLKALEKADAPAEDEMVAALKDAEAVAAEYEEIAGPMVRAIKALQARLPAPVVEQEEQQPAEEQGEEPDVVTRAEAARLAEQARQEAAIEALNELHPDRLTVKESPEFKKWFATWKTPEYRSKVTTSWNPAVVAEPFTAFKAWQQAQQRKQERLDAAATPQGSATRATPTTLPDEEGARIGYERARRHRL